MGTHTASTYVQLPDPSQCTPGSSGTIHDNVQREVNKLKRGRGRNDRRGNVYVALVINISLLISFAFP